MALNGFILTDVGAALLSEAALSGDIVFTRGAIGSGALSADADIAARTALVAPVADMQLGRVQRDGDKICVSCRFTNLKSGGGYLSEFRWNEAGLFARLGESGSEVLLVYANTSDAAAGDLIPSTACEFELTVELAFTGMGDVEFSSAGIMYITQPELDAALALKAEKTHVHSAADVTAGTLNGRVVANSTAVGSLNVNQVRNIVISTSAPSGISNGDIWLSYTQ